MAKKSDQSLTVPQSSALSVFDPGAEEYLTPMRKAQGAVKVGGGLWPYASSRGATWKVGGKAVGNEFIGVIIGIAAENRYYSQPYNPNKLVAPDCYAICHASGDPEEARIAIEQMGPPASLESKESDVCGKCPQNAWGSDPKGGRGKACKNQRRIIVLGQATDYARAEGYRVSVPVMSVRNLADYAAMLDAVGVPLAAIETRFTVQPLGGGGHDITFSPAGETVRDSVIRSGAQLKAILAKAEAGQESLLAPPQMADDDAPRSGSAAVQTRRKVEKIVAGKRRK